MLLEGRILPWTRRGCVLQVAHGGCGSWVWHKHQDAAALTLRLYISESVPGSALLSTLTDLPEGGTPQEQSYGVWKEAAGAARGPAGPYSPCWWQQGDSCLVTAFLLPAVSSYPPPTSIPCSVGD